MAKSEMPDRLRTARRLAGLTQEQLASALGVTVRTYARWERGETTGYYRALDEIAEATDTTRAQLLGLADDADDVAARLAVIEGKLDALADDLQAVVRRLDDTRTSTP